MILIIVFVIFAPFLEPYNIKTYTIINRVAGLSFVDENIADLLIRVLFQAFVQVYKLLVLAELALLVHMLFH